MNADVVFNHCVVQIRRDGVLDWTVRRNTDTNRSQDVVDSMAPLSLQQFRLKVLRMSPFVKLLHMIALISDQTIFG